MDPLKKVCLNIILKCTKNKLSAYTAYAAMFVVRDRVPNLITHLLTANTANINGRTQCKHISEFDSSAARQVDTPHKQWTLREYHYIIHSYNKYRWLNTGVTDFSNIRETAVSFCIEPSICCFTLPCIKLIFSGIILCYVMYVAGSSISFASLLATSSDTEKYVKLYIHAMLMYLIVSFEK